MSDKELIKQEIEKRIKNLEFSLENNCVEKHSKLDILGNITTLESLLQFIDSLPEEHNEDLEEYYTKEFLPKEWFANPGHRTISQFNFFTAQHFAEWQKQKDLQDFLEKAERAFLALYNSPLEKFERFKNYLKNEM